MQRGTKMKKKPLIVLAVICFCLMIIIGIQAGKTTFCADDTDTYQIYINKKSIKEAGLYINHTPYLPVSMIGTQVQNPGISLDPANERLNIDLTAQQIQLGDTEITSFVKTYAEKVYIPLYKVEESYYFPLNTTCQFFKLNYTVEENKNKINIQPYTKEEKEGRGSFDFYAAKKTKQQYGMEKISLAWQYAGATTPSTPSVKHDGLDILSPTWFHLITDGGGNIQNTGDKGYSDDAHNKGYQVWATITNSMSTKGSTAFTTKIFQDSAELNKSVAQYLFYACLYDVDGINIDYEDVADSDAPGLVAFTALLRNYTERQGLTLSIDTLIPKPWTIEYDRAALSHYVDYLVIMTYDEHYGGSPTAGSISSLPWVEEAVQATLQEVPPSKLLLGIPLYTRIWTVDSKGKVLSNPSAKMPAVRETIASANTTPVWLEEEKQYYIEYPNETNVNKVWIEDSRSVANRLNLINKYDLAGAACWQLSQGEDEIWEVFQGMLKNQQSLSNYEKPYSFEIEK